jgi:hypothetical protein
MHCTFMLTTELMGSKINYIFLVESFHSIQMVLVFILRLFQRARNINLSTHKFSSHLRFHRSDQKSLKIDPDVSSLHAVKQH